MNRLAVLVVDDEVKIREVIREYLEADGFAVVEAGSGQSAIAAAEASRPDLVVLDLSLPGLHGLDVLARLRQGSDLPVIVVTARSEEVDKLIGLSAGADDYLTKPFSGRELVARIRAVLRRSSRVAEADDSERPMRIGALTIDRARREVTGPRGPATLTALDFELLVELARHPGQVLSRRQLLEAVWGGDHFGDERIVDVHIRTLRRALGDDASSPSLIGTVRAVGYRMIT